jgi:hypothetical protein
MRGGRAEEVLNYIKNIGQSSFEKNGYPFYTIFLGSSYDGNEVDLAVVFENDNFERFLKLKFGTREGLFLSDIQGKSFGHKGPLELVIGSELPSAQIEETAVWVIAQWASYVTGKRCLRCGKNMYNIKLGGTWGSEEKRVCGCLQQIRPNSRGWS